MIPRRAAETSRSQSLSIAGGIFTQSLCKNLFQEEGGFMDKVDKMEKLIDSLQKRAKSFGIENKDLREKIKNL